MTALLVVLILFVVFSVSIISPRAADKIQKITNNKAGRLKRMSNWLWDPLTWWAKHTIKFAHGAIIKNAKRGKRVRKKISKKKNTDT